MLITRETDYAVRTVLYLAKENDRMVNVSEISRAMHIPKSFLAKILQRLVLRGMVKSARGIKGGFQLAKRPADISLLNIMEAIQGPAGINLCAVDGKKCRMSSTCCVHPIWVDIRHDIEKRLQKQTIAGLLQA
ncbi:MAG TPA: Rrf2 family transcriptional regulator [Nitrospirota bacterium]|nr:Rrf2 family transcriptional regulator [Nitrospirota bacterium]